MNEQLVSVSDVNTTACRKVRAFQREDKVEEYADLLSSGTDLPPLVMFTEGDGTYYLADGGHRFDAYLANEADQVPAIVHDGGLREALLHAAGANAEHGIYRTSEEKRLSVQILLEDEETAKLSLREIARMACVSHQTVHRMTQEREEVSQSDSGGWDDGLDDDPSGPPAAPPTTEPEPITVQGSGGAAVADTAIPEAEASLAVLMGMVADQCKRAANTLRKVANDPNTPQGYIDEQNVATLRNVMKELLNSAPAAVCWDCNGEGCRYCGNRGVKTHLQVERARA